MELLYQRDAQTRIGALTTPVEAIELVQVLEEIADELRWQPGRQLRDNAGSAWHLAVKVGDRLVGGLQAVPSGGNIPLPFRQVWPDVEAGKGDGVLHVTMLALTKEHRGKPHLFGTLCVELWRQCLAASLQTIVLEATPLTLRVYRRLGWPLEIIGDLRLHWGEPCYLCRMGVQDVATALSSKAHRADSRRTLIQQAYRDAIMEVPRH